MTASSQPRLAPIVPVPCGHGAIGSDRLIPRAGLDQQLACVPRVNVLVIVGNRTRSVGAQLIRAAADSSPHGIRVRVFDGLSDLPDFSPALTSQPTPDCVVELHAAAGEAHAALLLTPYRGRIPTMVHNAIEWLTLGWNQSSLHDKPLAVMGPSAGTFSGIWSHHQSTDGGWGLGPLVVESITVSTLAEAVRKLAGEVTPACSASQQLPTSGGDT